VDGAFELVHATAVAVGGDAVLIRGPSGSGKSDLALRCLAVAPCALIPAPAGLVADDQVRIERVGDRLRASAPPAIRDKLEVRGLGIVTVPAVPAADVVLIADLVSAAEIERLPEPMPPVRLLGIEVPVLRLAPFEPSAPIKLLMALCSRRGRNLGP
jgi:serine kinase of HPr protein (carbohydrate metabolism regulator)